MNRLSKYAVAAVLSAAIFGTAQSANAQGLLGWFFGVGQCAGGQCYSSQCYGRTCASGQCYSGQCYGRTCASGQCYSGQYYGRTCASGQCAGGKCSLTSSAQTVEKDETFSGDPEPLGVDYDPLNVEEQTTDAPCQPVQEIDVPTCSPCQPVQEIDVPAPRKRPVVEGIKAAAGAIAENVYLARVNRVRAQYGLRALEIDSNLDYQCSTACRNCAAYGAIYHESNCGAEILASNYSRGIDGALNQWLWSQAHARLLLNPNYTRCGVRTYVDANGKNYCAMRFR